MHVHANQFALNSQRDALYAAAKAEAKLSAERTRKKLLNFTSAFAGEVDGDAACLVSLCREGAPRDQSNQQGRQSEGGQNKQNTQMDSGGDAFSGWA